MNEHPHEAPALRHAIRVVAVVVTAVILIGATVSSATLIAGRGSTSWPFGLGLGGLPFVSGPTSTESDTTTFNAPLTNIVVSVNIGHVHVVGSSDPNLRIDRVLTYSSARPAVSAVRAGNTVTIQGRCPSTGLGERCTTDYTLHAPAAAGLDITDDIGAVEVAAIDGQVSIHARIGSVTVSGGSGQLGVDGGVGEVNVSRSRSPHMDITTGVGAVNLEFAAAPNDVRVQTSTGHVDMGLVDDGSAYDVEPSANLGHVTMRVRTDPASPRHIVATTSVGSINVHWSTG
jgi:hypothetical protein